MQEQRRTQKQAFQEAVRKRVETELGGWQKATVLEWRVITTPEKQVECVLGSLKSDYTVWFALGEGEVAGSFFVAGTELDYALDPPVILVRKNGETEIRGGQWWGEKVSAQRVGA